MSGFQSSDFYGSAGIGGGSANSVRLQYRSQPGGILVGPSQSPSGFVPQQPSFLKRSLTDLERNQQQLQQLQQLQQQSLLLRSVKQRTHQTSPISPLSPIDFSAVSPEISTASSSAARLRFPLQRQQQQQQQQQQPNNPNSSFISFSSVPNRIAASGAEPNSEKMRNQLQELERQLLDDNDDESSVSAITSSEWNETMQNLITPKPLSPSPTSSSSSSSSSTSSPPSSSSKQLLTDSATAISEGKIDAATAILRRLKQSSNGRRGDQEQRLTAYMAAALLARINPSEAPPIAELCSAEHLLATQMLYEASPCFKLGFMAANLAILDATRDQPKIHIVDFDIGQGSQYITLIHALAERQLAKPTVKITAVNDPSSMIGRNNGADPLRAVGDGLKKLAQRVGIGLRFNVLCCRPSELRRESIGCDPDESLAVNFAFRLYRMPDESVSTANPRDELLRVVKRLSPTVVTLVEQDLNTNTAPFLARFGESWSHYRALVDSLDATLARDSSERVRVEECLARKAANAVAQEGRERVERCEVFGKWRARMGMAGFQPRPLGSHIAESLSARLGTGRTHPGFFVKEEGGGIGFGWMGRILTVASAWR